MWVVSEQSRMPGLRDFKVFKDFRDLRGFKDLSFF